MAAEVHVGDIGTVFEPTVKDEAGAIVDLSSAGVKQIRFRKPNGTVVVKTAVLSGTGVDGKMRYVTLAGDLDLDGRWRAQGYVEVGPGKWSTDMHRFIVHPNLS